MFLIGVSASRYHGNDDDDSNEDVHYAYDEDLDGYYDEDNDVYNDGDGWFVIKPIHVVELCGEIGNGNFHHPCWITIYIPPLDGPLVQSCYYLLLVLFGGTLSPSVMKKELALHNTIGCWTYVFFVCVKRGLG